MEFTYENMMLHFSTKQGNPYEPHCIYLGDGSSLTKQDAINHFEMIELAKHAQHC
jgi:hypothetical protein